MIKYISVLFLLISCKTAPHAQKGEEPSISASALFNPQKTQVLIAGVLKWQDPNISSFSDRHRKDVELKEQFVKMGVSDNDVNLLLDENATLKSMQKGMEKGMQLCSKEGTFIFYYAGHGTQGKGTHYLCNYDMGKNVDSWFDVEMISQTAKAHFKGKRIILLADCCYSGSLLGQAEKIRKYKPEVEVIVLSSATSSNISTGNWTYTQTLLDGLRGDYLIDLNADGRVTLNEVQMSISDAMKYREHQKNGFIALGVHAEKIEVNKSSNSDSSIKRGSGTSVGQYLHVMQKGDWKVARVAGDLKENVNVEFYDYSDKSRFIVPKAETQFISFTSHPNDTKIKVEWEGGWYDAVVLRSEDDFMYIHYLEYDNSFDEWVMYDRVRTGNERKAQIEWRGNWYPGTVLSEKDGKYFITYTGFKKTWDEWVGRERVRLE